MRVAVLEVDRAGQRVDGVGEAGGAGALGLLLQRERGVDERGVDDAAVAARALGAVQRAVGEAHQAHLVAGVARELRDPGAEREPGVTRAGRRGGRRAADPLDDPLGAPGVGVDQREQELVAADPAADVAGPQLALQDARGDPQRLVAGGVAVGVVELLEVVDVEDDDGDLLLAVAGALERLVERVVQPAVVEHPGQRVLQGQALDARVQRLHRPAQRVERAGQRRRWRRGAASRAEDRDVRPHGPWRRRRGARPAARSAGGRSARCRSQQQRGADAGQQHLAAAGGERLGTLGAGEAQGQHGDRAAGRRRPPGT